MSFYASAVWVSIILQRKTFRDPAGREGREGAKVQSWGGSYGVRVEEGVGGHSGEGFRLSEVGRYGVVGAEMGR